MYLRYYTGNIMHWHILNSQLPQTIEDLKKILLGNRNITEEADFFTPKHPSVISAAEAGIDQKSLDKAVARILLARENNEKVVVFGDYDVDGVSATAILWKTLYALKLNAHPFIPQRGSHGYGLSHAALDEILAAEEKPALIITVDNGIVAHEPAKRLQKEGVDLIISDHHQPENEGKKILFPPAHAIVHSTQLCGATVSWMLARAVMQADGKEIGEEWELDLAAIATIADQVPLRGANRSFAYHGLKALRNSRRVGLLALLEQAGMDQRTLTSQSIGFSIAPRINAMGRLASSLDALRLLVTSDPQRATKLASTLGLTNTKRQDLTYELYNQALQQAKEWENEHIIIVHSDSYHEGVIGLIAGRLMEQFYKPAICLSVNDSTAKASARSIPGVNIVELIREVRSDLLEVGGHPMAAGFGLETTKLDTVIKRLQALAKEKIPAALLEPSVQVDALLPLELVKEETVSMIDQLAPFGSGNDEPVFGFKELEVLQVMTMGKENAHLKLVAHEKDNVQPLYFLAWRKGSMARELQPGDKVNIAGVLEINAWKNKTSMQVMIKDIEKID